MVSDLVLPMAWDQFREWRETKLATSHLQESPGVAEVSPAGESVSREALPTKSEANKGASSPQWVLETTQGMLEHIHASRL